MSPPMALPGPALPDRTLISIADANLPPSHQDALFAAITKGLSSPRAESTMAQLVDGLPLCVSVYATDNMDLDHGHPLHGHTELCNYAMEYYHKIREEMDFQDLQFQSHLLQAYSDAHDGSQAFKLRLLEMVAVSIHQIAVNLFNQPEKCHRDEFIQFVTNWSATPAWHPIGDKAIWIEPLRHPPPTFFATHTHQDWDIYPEGIADIAGYWAEYRIFGGVVVFDRGTGAEAKNAFIHPGQEERCHNIWRLEDEQVDSLTAFWLSGSDEMEDNPLPFCATDEQRYRLDPWEAIAWYHVYRDPWERKIQERRPEGENYRNKGTFFDDAPHLPKIDPEFIKLQGGHFGEPRGAMLITPKEPPGNPRGVMAAKNGAEESLKIGDLAIESEDDWSLQPPSKDSVGAKFDPATYNPIPPYPVEQYGNIPWAKGLADKVKRLQAANPGWEPGRSLLWQSLGEGEDGETVVTGEEWVPQYFNPM